jgi:hypothetical protein
MTLIKQPPNEMKHLLRFVLHYSICPAVHEIKILWDEKVNLHIYLYIHRWIYGCIRIYRSGFTYIYTYLFQKDMGREPCTHDTFKFTKTHSIVTFHHENNEKKITEKNEKNENEKIFNFLDIKTESVLYLDPDVFISCTDLLFAHSVWRSGSDALVGFFPRLHGYIFTYICKCMNLYTYTSKYIYINMNIKIYIHVS